MRDDGGTAETRHYWLTQGMARAQGVNLCAAIACGALSRDGLDRLVESCAACGRQAECLPWLGRNAAIAEAPPGYCANRAALALLRRRMRDAPPRSA